jgi:cytochrome c peroxidase
MKNLLFLIAMLATMAIQPKIAFSHGTPPPKSLRGVHVPRTPGLVGGGNPIVVNQRAAIMLGKALFWDVNVGSDGMACASCHFHAGADRRTHNQIGPGQLHANEASGTTFEATASGGPGGPNHGLGSADFPLFQFENPADKKSPVIFSTDDVVGSSGTFKGIFQNVLTAGSGNDECAPDSDAVFHAGGRNARQATTRNTPTVINAAFNFRNFWDGRANNSFNGESPFGARDPQTGVWVAKADGSVSKTRLSLANASLASQAMAPPLNDVEMSCAQRRFPDIGRKLLQRRPLENQEIHFEDSVLRTKRDASGKGLNTTYEALIRKAFASRYWSGKGDFGAPANGRAPYSQMEANFSFFFGLALQLYESTLISNKSPYDTPPDKAGVPKGLNDQQKRGLTVFLNAHCVNCHRGPTFSAAAHPYIYAKRNKDGPILLERSVINGAVTGNGVSFALRDEGFANTSVVPAGWDPGIGGSDPFGNPLSFARQYVNALLNGRVDLMDPVKVYPCDFETPFAYDHDPAELVDDPNGHAKGKCKGARSFAKVPAASVFAADLQKPGQGRAFFAVDGAFKIPTLRNVELTGPYMHNGSMKSLEEVVDFYNRGGNVANPDHFATLVFQQGFTSDEKADLVAFLKSLTDERVRWERAPFDHPELPIPEGHEEAVSPLGSNLAKDRFLHIPAVGKNGRTSEQGPLQPFDSYLQP